MAKARRRGLRALALFAVAALLAVGGALLLQTEVAFSHFVLPLVASRFGMQGSAAGGRLRLGGAMEVRDLELRGETTAVRITRGEIRFAPRSLYAAARPRVEAIEIDGATIEIRGGVVPTISPRRSSAFPADEAPTLASLRVPVEIPRAHIHDATIRVLGEGGEPRLQVRVDDATLKDLIPGHSANLDLTGSVVPVGPDSEPGNVKIYAALAQSDQAIVTGWRLSAHTQFAASGAGEQPYEMYVGSDGVRQETAEMNASVTLDGRRGPRRVGRARATWREQPGKEGAPRTVDVEIQLSDVQRDTLNSVLALAGRPPLDAVELDGNARLAFSGNDVALDASAVAAVGGGTVKGRLHKRGFDEPQTGDLDLTVRGVDIARAAPIADTRDRYRLRGTLDLSASLKATGERGATLLDRCSGDLTAQVRNGRVAELGLLRFLAAETGVEELRDLHFDTLDAKLRFDEGTARIEKMDVVSATMRSQVSGSARIPDNLDLGIGVRLGPDMLRRAGKIPVVGQLAASADGLLELPITVRVSGRFSDPHYTVVPHVPGTSEARDPTLEGAVRELAEDGRKGAGRAAAFVDRILRRDKRDQ